MSTMGHNTVNKICPFPSPNHSIPLSMSMQGFKEIHKRLFKLESGKEVLMDQLMDVQTLRWNNIITHHHHVAGYESAYPNSLVCYWKSHLWKMEIVCMHVISHPVRYNLWILDLQKPFPLIFHDLWRNTHVLDN